MFFCLLLYACMCALQTASMGMGCWLYFGETLGKAKTLQYACCNQISLCVCVCVHVCVSVLFFATVCDWR